MNTDDQTKASSRHYQASRLDDMIRWYALVIGAQVNFRDQVAAWMTNDAANHRIAFLAVPGLGDDADKTQHSRGCTIAHSSTTGLLT